MRLKNPALLLCLLLIMSEISSGQQTRPELFAPGIVSTEFNEFGVTFAPDGKTIYFAKSDFQYKVYVIAESHWQNNRWTKPEIVSFSGGKWKDLDPCLSPDGQKMFFASTRPVSGQVERKDYDLWMAEQGPNGWNDPVHLGGAINSEADETTTSVTSDGTLYLASERAGGKGKRDLYRAKPVNGSYEKLEALGGEFNTEFDDSNQYVEPDESYLIFSSRRAKGGTEAGLFISYNDGGAWTAPEQIGAEILGRDFIIAPTVTPDGKYLVYSTVGGFFDRNFTQKLTFDELVKNSLGPGNGFADVYQIPIQVLKIKNAARK